MIGSQEGAQSRFAAAVCDPALAIPADLAPSSGRAPQRRFAVYRNNVAVALIGALETRFPACRRIVGEAFFRELARAHVAESPPRSPVMMTYGDEFPAFCETVEALGELPYLADVARLEAARTRAYHAADAAALGSEVFTGLDPVGLDSLVVTLHPSVEIVVSAHPVVTVWAMNAGETPLGVVADWSPEDALVVRPELDVVVRRLRPGGAVFLSALGRGLTLGGAAEAATEAAPAFDLTLNLIGLIEAGLAVGLGAASKETPQ